MDVTNIPVTRTDQRPWGTGELYIANAQATVKVITVEPGHRLSLQWHESRDEWWTALDDGSVAEVGDDSRHLSAGDKACIPRGTTHRPSNQGTRPARVLEVAFGRFDECDIERLEDDYNRRPRHDVKEHRRTVVRAEAG